MTVKTQKEVKLRSTSAGISDKENKKTKTKNIKINADSSAKSLKEAAVAAASTSPSSRAISKKEKKKAAAATATAADSSLKPQQSRLKAPKAAKPNNKKGEKVKINKKHKSSKATENASADTAASDGVEASAATAAATGSDKAAAAASAAEAGEGGRANRNRKRVSGSARVLKEEESKKSKEKKRKEKKALARRGVLYVGHLPDGFMEYQLRAFFKQFGGICSVRLFRSVKTGRSKGYAFIEFALKEVAEVAAQTMNKYRMFGRTLVCRVIDRNTVHPHVFNQKKRVIGPYRQILAARREAQKHNKPDGTRPSARGVEAVEGKLKKKMQKLKEMNIEYEMPTLGEAKTQGGHLKEWIRREKEEKKQEKNNKQTKNN